MILPNIPSKLDANSTVSFFFFFSPTHIWIANKISELQNIKSYLNVIRPFTTKVWRNTSLSVYLEELFENGDWKKWELRAHIFHLISNQLSSIGMAGTWAGLYKIPVKSGSLRHVPDLLQWIPVSVVYCYSRMLSLLSCFFF